MTNMTTRIWQGRTLNEHAEVYTRIIELRDIPDYRAAAGFVKLSFLKRSDAAFTHFTLLTYWTDLAAVKGFAGAHFETAKAYDEDAQYLLDFPGRASHFEVFAE